MDRIKAFLENDRFARHAGIELLEASPGRARARMALHEKHLNGVGIAHGGAIFTLADFAFAAASNAHGTVAVAINAHISFVKAVSGGVLTAEAREVARGAKLGTYDVEIQNESGDLIASFHGMVYRKKDAI
jgi:acyl-CoA thioesterase